MQSLLEQAGFDSAEYTAVALDNYEIDVPSDDFKTHGVIAAVEVDGKPLTVRDRGRPGSSIRAATMPLSRIRSTDPAAFGNSKNSSQNEGNRQRSWQTTSGTFPHHPLIVPDYASTSAI